MFNIDEFAREVHENAIAHGWWETERPIEEIIALIHSEWSESLEEYRAGKPMHYYSKDANGRDKPEGIAVELIDGVIRILDFIAHENADVNDGVDYEKFIAMSQESEAYAYMQSKSLPTFVATLHKLTSDACSYDPCVTDDTYILMYTIIAEVFIWLRANAHEIDAFELMREKFEYNKSRPYKHGKKC